MSDDDRKIFTACQKDFDQYVTVYYDAWENDGDDDPVLSLVYSIVNNVNADFEFANAEDCLKKAAGILEFFTGKSWTKLIESFKGNDPLEKIKASKSIETMVKDFLDSLLIERGNRLIIFIDELDRCKPSYAVKLLERIKHYFSNDRITFVFSINTKELQHTIKKHYGNEFDAYRYLDRFFDLRMTIPKPDLEKFYQSINFNNTYYVFDVLCGDIIKNYNFTLREISRYLKIANMAAYEFTHRTTQYDLPFPDGRGKQFCLLYIVPIMIALNIYDHDRYERFIAGKDSSQLTENLSNFKGHFGDLLGSDESYSASPGKKIVTLEEKLNAVYDAVFNRKYSYEYPGVTIGKYGFDERTKEFLFEVVGLLSEHTAIEKEAQNENE